MSENWKDAEFGGQEQMVAKEPEMTTDDLVIFVGEAVINKRHAERVVAYLRQQVTVLQQSLAKEKSIQASSVERAKAVMEERVNAALLDKETAVREVAQLDAIFIAKAGELTTIQINASKAEESLRSRILQLEEQVHQVALERDEARKNEQSALAALAEVGALRILLADIQTKSTQKRKSK